MIDFAYRRFVWLLGALALVALAGYALGLGERAASITYGGFALFGAFLAVFDDRAKARVAGLIAALVFAVAAVAYWIAP